MLSMAAAVSPAAASLSFFPRILVTRISSFQLRILCSTSALLSGNGVTMPHISYTINLFQQTYDT